MYTLTWSHANWCIMLGDKLVAMYPTFDVACLERDALNRVS